MPRNEKKRQSSWKDRFRFAVFNDTTYEEVWRIRLSKYNALLALAFLVFLIVGITSSLIAFTNLREFIPGYLMLHSPHYNNECPDARLP